MCQWTVTVLPFSVRVEVMLCAHPAEDLLASRTCRRALWTRVLIRQVVKPTNLRWHTTSPLLSH